jgi:hypothetical protein
MGQRFRQGMDRVRIPEHREHRFRPIVNTDSGILNSDSGDRER